MTRLLVFLTIIATSTPALSQKDLTDSQHLRALLEEVRQLRRDLQTATSAAQRVQIALYRLQLQDAAVARATRLVEESHSKLTDLADARARIGGEMERSEDLRNRIQDAADRDQLEQRLADLKRDLERIARDEQQWRAKASQAEQQLRDEQIKLDSLHSLLDQLDQALERTGNSSASASNR